MYGKKHMKGKIGMGMENKEMTKEDYGMKKMGESGYCRKLMNGEQKKEGLMEEIQGLDISKNIKGIMGGNKNDTYEYKRWKD